MEAENLIYLRKANIEDLDLLLHWDQQEHVKVSNPYDEWDYEADLKADYEWQEQYIAEVNGKAIGFLHIIDPYLEETHYWGKVEANLKALDIWIGEKDYLNRGFGSQMMRKAFEICFSNPEVKGILIDPLESNKDAIRFYNRLGFKFLEKRKFGEDICDVHFLSRKDYENLSKNN